jgi:hypothetical protein
MNKYLSIEEISPFHYINLKHISDYKIEVSFSVNDFKIPGIKLRITTENEELFLRYVLSIIGLTKFSNDVLTEFKYHDLVILYMYNQEHKKSFMYIRKETDDMFCLVNLVFYPQNPYAVLWVTGSPTV